MELIKLIIKGKLKELIVNGKNIKIDIFNKLIIKAIKKS